MISLFIQLYDLRRFFFGIKKIIKKKVNSFCPYNYIVLQNNIFTVRI